MSVHTAFASIITIGDELLIGQVIDTNSAFIAQQLNEIGIPVKQRLAVGDNEKDIWEALDAQKTDIVIITGGLGPTADDITKPLLCKYFDGEMILHQPTLEHIIYLFTEIYKRPLPLLERNKKQAEVPNVCSVLKNELGTAPGMMFEKNGKLFFSLPGVPHEMKGLITKQVIPIIKDRFKPSCIIHKTLLTANIGESVLAERLLQIESQFPTNIKLAYLPNFGFVRLRLTGSSNNEQELENLMQPFFSEIKKIVADVLVTDKDEPLEAVIGKLLLQKKKTLGTAESCTGGYIAHLITSLAGSSAYYLGGVVAYSNKLKQDLLGVQFKTIENIGAVSEETVTEMVLNVLSKLQTDYALAVSGIMGPDGGTKEKPVGTVWVAVASNKHIITKKFQFRFGRQKNIQLTAINALNLLRELIVDKP